MTVTLTEKAALRIKKYLTKRGKGIGLRLSVQKGGCSGFSYKLEYVDNLAPNDQIFESYGARIVVDSKSLLYIDGIQLDFYREGINEGFKFSNPNVKGKCGCGESFHI